MATMALGTVRLVALPEAADVLGVSIYTIRRLIDCGDMRCVRIGARVMVPSDHLAEIMTKGVGTPRKRRGRRGAGHEQND